MNIESFFPNLVEFALSEIASCKDLVYRQKSRVMSIQLTPAPKVRSYYPQGGRRLQTLKQPSYYSRPHPANHISLLLGAKYLVFVSSRSVKMRELSFAQFVYSVDSIKRTVHLAFHGLFSLLKILFTNSKQYF